MKHRDRRPPAVGKDEVPGPALTVSASVGRRFFKDRLTDQYAHHYHLIVSIFKGVALGSAAISFLAIVGSQEATLVKVTALALWLTSLAAMMATYDGIMVSSIMVTTPPNTIDLVAPFLMGLTEFMLFAVLMPLPADSGGVQPSAAAQLEHLTWWPLVFASLTLVATTDIANTKAQLTASAPQAPKQVQPLVYWYIGSLRHSWILTAICTVAVLVAFLGLRLGPDALHRWQGVMAVIVLFGMVNGILDSERARQRIVASVDAVVRPGSDPPGAVL